MFILIYENKNIYIVLYGSNEYGLIQNVNSITPDITKTMQEVYNMTTINNYLWVSDMAQLTGLTPLHSSEEKQLIKNIQNFFSKQ